MKKVLILAAAIALAATPAFASSIVGSKHDLRAGQPGGDSTFVQNTGGSTQVCVFCHTPHGAGSVNPLWNRSASTGISGYYNSVTLDSATRPATVSGEVDASDAPLCLSCHDGANVVGGLLNPPNDGTVAFGQPLGFNAPPGDGVNLSLGGDLSNDHPIGMNYSQVAGNSGTTEFNVSTGLTFYGANNKVMWCSTCHDVHNDANAPFLAADNTNSGLCTTCHVK